MSYLLYIRLPDESSALGYVAAVLSEVEGDIRNVDAVDRGASSAVVGNIAVDPPMDLLPNALITAARSVSGVETDPIKPFSDSVDHHGQIALLAEFSQHMEDLDHTLRDVVDSLPQTVITGWAIILGGQSSDQWVHHALPTVIPEDSGQALPEAPVDSPRSPDPDEET